MLDSEHVFVHLVHNSIFLNAAEQQAIIQENLPAYLAQIQAERNVFDQLSSKQEDEVDPKSEDSKNEENQAPRMIIDGASIDRDWVELGGDANHQMQIEVP